MVLAETLDPSKKGPAGIVAGSEVALLALLAEHSWLGYSQLRCKATWRVDEGSQAH